MDLGTHKKMTSVKIPIINKVNKPSQDCITDKQSRQVKTPVESADQNSTYSGAQSPEHCVVLFGDSIIKNIIPHKLSRKKVYKFTYPGKLAEEIESEIRDIDEARISPSYVINTLLDEQSPN